LSAKNVGGTVTTSSSITHVLVDEATNIIISNSGNDLLIRVTGIIATTIDRLVTFKYIEN
jgi:hypothetical protein